MKLEYKYTKNGTSLSNVKEIMKCFEFIYASQILSILSNSTNLSNVFSLFS